MLKILLLKPLHCIIKFSISNNLRVRASNIHLAGMTTNHKCLIPKFVLKIYPICNTSIPKTKMMCSARGLSTQYVIVKLSAHSSYTR